MTFPQATPTIRPFKRGLSKSFIDALNTLKDIPGNFWQRMVANPELLIGIRDEYINVYYMGQSICRLELWQGIIRGSTHRKYLGIPEKGYVKSENGIISHPEATVRSLADIGSLKANCEPRIGREKKQSYEKVLLSKKSNIIDVEAAFVRCKVPVIRSRSDYEISTIDYVTLEDGVLVFHEAKHYKNQEIRSGIQKPKVLDQLRRYEEALRLHYDEILKSYSQVLQNRKDLGLWGSVPENLSVDVHPRLEVFGVNGAGNCRHLQLLKKELGGRLITH